MKTVFFRTEYTNLTEKVGSLATLIFLDLSNQNDIVIFTINTVLRRAELC